MADAQERPLVGAYTGTIGGFLGLNLRNAMLTPETNTVNKLNARTATDAPSYNFV